ncbi:P-loop containing nucleoside triphosphate hydrolase protein [Auricularia subglabra TFB-10046 SS5]|nr:P-loop containing nucleoside triphosphate hydrolase protein [Auricularia subglabra TFB-10046 SS5]
MCGARASSNIIQPDPYADYSDSEDEFGESTGETPYLSELSDDELLLTTPILYGFSLNDKFWLEFNVVHVTAIKWNDEAFARLVLPRAQKDLIKGLVEAQAARGFEFDDFIEGKGRGLVINLFGPPGVGKTMSAEAVSEHLRRPLYMVAAGELATSPRDLERDLSRIFRIGSHWGSVTLLDEADVFLEQRSLHDLQRNALVAIFLRQLEYFPGLLFVTTNRVRAFDHAFQSRIHVSLRFRELTEDARREVWRAFIAKLVNVDPLSDSEEDSLVERQFNGRQIKNAVRTASTLAASRGEKVSYAILCDVVDIMEQFEADFSELKESGTV